ncbi:hypothetical protein BJ165DRAFT_1122445 [Panaeolus papilionaceus]|nr:hypothetical protein BJ165DRAFT_1122445 [Panaeolus papilionaceus]
MEQLQIMEYRFRNERLSFTDNLICSKKELAVLDMDQEHIEKLLNEGKLELLHKYIDESKQQWGEGSK